MNRANLAPGSTGSRPPEAARPPRRHLPLARLALGTLAFAILPAPTLGQTATERSWSFDRFSDLDGWTASNGLEAVVMGGSLWISLVPRAIPHEELGLPAYQISGGRTYEMWKALARGEKPTLADQPRLVSAPDLGFVAPPGRQVQVRLRLINQSPLSDIKIFSRVVGDEPGAFPQQDRCAIQPMARAWQEVTCYVTRSAKPLDRISIQFSGTSNNLIRGDVWLDTISVGLGAEAPAQSKPDIIGAGVRPQIHVSGLSDDDVLEAFKVIDEAVVYKVPGFGFRVPFLTPGGLYHQDGWWLIDAGEGMAVAKWTNQSFAENMVLGFAELQAANPDGRIDAGAYAAVRGQPADVSQLPTYIEAAYDVARHSRDPAFREAAYSSLRDYLRWWLSPVKRDRATGLITAIHEETFGEDPSLRVIAGPNAVQPQSIAAVDTNVMVAVAAHLLAALARQLGKTEDAANFTRVFEELRTSINLHLWDEAIGAYLNLDLKTGKREPKLLVSIFDPLRMGIAPPDRRARLLARMTDPAEFNWGRRPLTSIAMTDPLFKEVAGPFNHTMFRGNVWSLLNRKAMLGLRESGADDLAAELNWATIEAFKGKDYRENMLATSPGGAGSVRYAWSAAHVLQGLIETLFGVDADVLENSVRIRPLVPSALVGKTLRLYNLVLPQQPGARLSVEVLQTQKGRGTIRVRVSGAVPRTRLIVSLPGTDKEQASMLRRDQTFIFE